MHSGKQNEDLAHRLQDLLPEGSSFDAGAAWSGVARSLHRKRRRVALAGWSVAACLLLAACAWWMAGNETPTPPAPVAKQTAAPVKSAPAPAADPAPVTTATAHAPAQQPQQRVHGHQAPPREEIAVAPKPDGQPSAPVVDSVAVASVTETPSAPALPAQNASPARRFRVAHITDAPLRLPDLSTPPEEKGILGRLFGRARTPQNTETDN